MVLDSCTEPVVLAPLAGGPSTPELTAAVSEAGGFGFLAAGYLTPGDLAERLAATRRLTARPVGVNLFLPGTPAPAGTVDAYRISVAADAAGVGAVPGDPRWDADPVARRRALLRSEQHAPFPDPLGLRRDAV